MILFYDWEVLKYDNLVVIIDPMNKKEYCFVNDREGFIKFYEQNKNAIWAGFNVKYYDQYITKACILGFDLKQVNDFIIVQGREGWQYSTLFNHIKLNQYDVMPNPPIGLKTLEGFMGSDIRESDVDFNLDRKATDKELELLLKYCRHDVEECIKVFMRKIDDFNAMKDIVKEFKLPISCIGDSEARITAKVLGCRKQEYDDEFDYYFFDCLDIKKYRHVIEWFRNAEEDCTKEVNKLYDKPDEYTWKKHFYKRSLEVMVAGVPHVFGFGGLHGAPSKPIHRKGLILHVDVNNYYPSMLIAHGIVTRSATNDNYKLVYNTRKALKKKQNEATDKAEKKMWKKKQLPYKKMLNALSGAMKDKTNPAYDPRNNNIMCINGQLMLLDLIEHLEVVEDLEIIQSNTDGIILQIPDTDEAFNQVDDICYEWEQRCSTDECSILLELDVIDEIYQGDVNNYLWIDEHGGERKGAYVKELSPLDYDLPIVNKAIVDYLTNKTPVETTINTCDDLMEFQKLVKLSNKYEYVTHNDRKYNYKCYRVFASNDTRDGRILKCREGSNPSKFGNTPDNCFIYNDSVVGVKCPSKLDKQWYIDTTKRRIKEKFGLEVI
jgi:DNA polymerase